MVADRAGIVAGLVRQARELWASGPPPMPPQAIEQWLHTVTTAYEDWLDADETLDRGGVLGWWGPSSPRYWKAITGY